MLSMHKFYLATLSLGEDLILCTLFVCYISLDRFHNPLQFRSDVFHPVIVLPG